MDDKGFFNWGCWDGYHTVDGPQRPEEPAYMAGFECGLEQRHLPLFDTTAQHRSFAAYQKIKRV